jgi:hypothetical protein
MALKQTAENLAKFARQPARVENENALPRGGRASMPSESCMTAIAVLDTNRPDTLKLALSKEATTRSRVQTRCSA